MPVFFTRDGWLTPYAMACGYLHSQGETRLYSLGSGGGFAVETFDRDASGVVNSYGANLCAGIAFYETFRSLPDARKAFRAQVGGKLARRYESAPDVRRNVIA